MLKPILDVSSLNVVLSVAGSQNPQLEYALKLILDRGLFIDLWVSIAKVKAKMVYWRSMCVVLRLLFIMAVC